MTSQDYFPQSLLTQPIADRLAYFEGKIVAHPRLKEAYEALRQAILHPAGAAIIFVYGPTGVGKTTLRERVEQHLIEAAAAIVPNNPAHIPVVGLEAVSPETGRFNWKDYYRRALEALEEPLVRAKIDYGLRGIERNAAGELVVAYTVSPSYLRQALEKCLQHRSLQAFLVDEAQHFKKVVGGRRLLDQMDALKSLASLTDTVHVLLGTYELLDLTDLSAQLSRRSIDIHFSRYQADQSDDLQIFKNVVLTFQRHLPLPQEPNLTQHHEYLYEKSVGCVGVLKDWLYKALTITLENEEPTLTLKTLDRCAKPPQKLLRFARDIKEGEDLLRVRQAQQWELRSLLGLTSTPAASTTIVSSPSTTTKTKSRVGQRKPGRDPVGVSSS